MWESRKLVGLVLVVCALLAAPVRAVAAEPTTTTLVVAPAAPVAGSTAVATVTVAGAADGAVTIALGGTAYPATLAGGTASVTVGPFRKGTSTLTATYAGDDGHAASSASLKVKAEPPMAKPKVEFSASAARVSVGDTVTLRWRTTGAEKVKARGAWKGSREARGSVKVHITSRGKNVFRLTAKNAAGQQSAHVMVMAARKAKALTLTAPADLVMPGAKVPVTAAGLAAGEGWTLRLAGQVVATGKASDKGTVTQSLVVPSSVAEGAVALTITGSNPGRIGTATLSVLKAKSLPVAVEKPTLAKGATQTVSVTGLLPSEPVTVTYQGKTVAQGTADTDGSFMLTFDVGSTKGQQSVTVVGADKSRTGEATFDVVGKHVLPDPGVFSG